MPPAHPLGCQRDSGSMERALTCSGEPSISAPWEGSTPAPARQHLQRGMCPYAWCSLLLSPRGRTVYHPNPRGTGAKCSWFPAPGQAAHTAPLPWWFSPGKEGTKGGEGGSRGMRCPPRVRIQPGQVLRVRIQAWSPCPGIGRALAEALVPLLHLLWSHLSRCSA